MAETTGRSDTIIELRNVSVSFPVGRGESRTLHDIDLDIERGETIGIVGESGSGKSMLGNVLNDSIEKPGVVNGRVRYFPKDGDPVEITDVRTSRLKGIRWEEIAVVPQGGSEVFNPTRNIRTHFQETLDDHAKRRQEGMARARELLEDVNLDPEMVFDSYAHELSGGQKQRVLIALSLLLDPEILIMDEPTSALDLIMKRQIVNLLYDVRENYDTTIILISHDLPTVMGFVDRIAIMYAFEIIEVGSTETIFRDAAHPYTRALLKSVPSLEAPTSSISAIEGETPDPVNLPTGCSYHPRCPLATDRCEEEDPALIEVDRDHTAACFYTEQAADEIPLPFSGDEG